MPVTPELLWDYVDTLGVAPVLSLGGKASATGADGPGVGVDTLTPLTLLLE